MNNIDLAAKDVLEDVKRKHARDALNGVIGLLYCTHSVDEVKAMLKSAYEEAIYSP